MRELGFAHLAVAPDLMDEVITASGSRSSRSSPMATAGADAWSTRSAESTITADDDRTESTGSAPGGISATGSGTVVGGAR